MDITNEFDIAIVGMACRFPDADTVDQYWKNILSGKESIRALSEAELKENSIDKQYLDNPDYVNSGSFLENIDLFDASLFDYSVKEADLMDPQHRMFLHVVWEALENAGHAPDQCQDSIGVYAGSSSSSYLVDALLNQQCLPDFFSLQDLAYENNHDFLATRVAYKLNLKGPAVTIGSACSTSLVLIHHACQALIAGECDIAIAGGSRISVPQKSGYLYSQGGILSRDGKCCVFDKNASGTLSGSGAGAVVLRPLQNALDDGDQVYAIIKGSAINNDGKRKIGFTAPSVAGQAEVIRKALHVAEVNPESIGYIEAHGTGTSLGDPIEVKALTNAYKSFTQRKQYCAIGSVKANIGHLDAAAGIAGIIKAACVLKNKILPPCVNYREPNPEIDFKNSPFFVNAEAIKWQSSQPRRAAVSAFGIGGTNAHVILQENISQTVSGASKKWQLLVFSAKTREALEENMQRFSRWLEKNPTVNFSDAAYTLKVGRSQLEYRSCIAVQSSESAAAVIAEKNPFDIHFSYTKQRQLPLVFMFSGQGTQYPDMGKELYSEEPLFRMIIDDCAEKMRVYLDDVDIRDILFLKDDEAQDRAQHRLYHTRFTQPALFVLEYSLARLLESYGASAAAFIGHSIGEYVAACLSGVFSLNDALYIVCERANAMADMEAGAMLAVELSESALPAYLAEGSSIAAINGPTSCVVSGTLSAIDEMEQRFTKDGVIAKRLHTSHAFHSQMMEPCIKRFEKAFTNITLTLPQKPFISNLTGTWAEAKMVVTPQYWLDHLRHPVRFADGIKYLLNAEYALLEVGPGQTLTSLVKLQLGMQKKQQVFASMRDIKTDVSDCKMLLGALGKLWCAGVQIDWKTFYQDEKRARVTLPSYAFQSTRHWLVNTAVKLQKNKLSSVAGDSQNKLPMDDWFYRPVWKHVEQENTAQSVTATTLLCFVNKLKVIAPLIVQLRSYAEDIILVQKGTRFRSKGETVFEINPYNEEHYEKLFESLRQVDRLPKKILHAWNLNKKEPQSRETYCNAFHSLNFIARTMARVDGKFDFEIITLSNNMLSITGGELLHPGKSLINGPNKVIPKEFTHITCKSIDLGNVNELKHEKTLNALFREIVVCDNRPFVALRGGFRFVEEYESVALNKSSTETFFKKQGTYLITGGFGGIGATFAKFLCSQYQSHLILTTRHPLPPESEWQAWLNTHHSENTTSRKINLIQDLRRAGGDIHVVIADVANYTQMKQGMAVAEKQIGAITGIMHCAGIADGALIQARNEFTSENIFSAKVLGTQVLRRLFKKHPLDFFVLCSSLSTYIGPVGQVAYTSANAYQNAFARLNHSWQRVVSIGWDSWQGVGMAVDSLLAGKIHDQHSDEKSQATLKIIAHGIFPDEGIEIIERALNNGYPHMLVSTRTLDVFTQTSENIADETEESESLQQYHKRPELHNKYIAPREEVEATIADIWQEKFAIKPLGVTDDFFELHGHSLLALQVITEIKNRLNVILPAGSLYDYPTIEMLSSLVKEKWSKTSSGNITNGCSEKKRSRIQI